MAKKIIRYERNGLRVCVREDLKGKGTEFDLCKECEKYNLNSPAKNCYIAELLQKTSNDYGVIVPVFECASFRGEVAKPKQDEPDSNEENVPD